MNGEILSTDGETIIGMKNGVEYVLRFGATTSVATDGTKDGEKKEGADSKDADSKDDGGETSGRYVLVMARLNESLLEKPKLEEVPDAPDEKAAAPEKKEPSAADALKAADEAEAKMQAAIEERRRVERENRLKQDEYDEKVKAAQKNVRTLNNRFADWYYIVSDKEYAKIHLGRADIVKAKEKADEAKGDAAKP
jgi:hypothetical protein